MQASKKAFLEYFTSGVVSLEQAAVQGAGVHHSTVWRWRQGDPEFDQAVEKARRSVDDIRTMMVEDTAFAMILSGNASAGLIMGWLYARAPDRWRRWPKESAAEDGKVPVEILRRIAAKYLDAKRP